MNILDELERFEPFRKLSGRGKILLSQGVIRKECSRSTIALNKGQVVSGAYVVVSGRLRVFTLAPNGTEATLYFINPGETCVLALNCLFNDLLYPAWVQAEDNTVITLIPGAIYRRLFEQESTIQNMTVQALSTLVFRLMTELEQMHSSHQKQRLANFILLHASSEGILQMTQQQIAHHLGTTREVIARLLREFVANGLVRTQRGSLAILDASSLQKLISFPG
ncbi:MAG: Crp/Fnr family transcriptional regulator [Betaproteobacteria bacterium HGW-Betaproteobacteria-5]|nr:MAG: Crp/Fnr family transcriptional regulator [Betaproteobacteria bacterium HGW-Betaproteobacteria-5]